MTIERFEREYQEYHGITPKRRREQVRALSDLAAAAGKEAQDCTPSDIKGFLATLTEQGLSPATIGKTLKMIKPFYSWAWEADLIDADRLMAIRRLESPRQANGANLPRPYSRKELTEFWGALQDRWPRVDPKFWARWRRGTSHFRRIQPEAMRIQIEAIVALALQCGLRRQEIFLASEDDIHYDNAYVVVAHGKGGRTREVPHTARSREAVKAWLELRAELKPDHDALWLSLAWEDVATHPMRFTRFAELLTTIGDWQLHRFRHTAGTEWLRATKRLEIVQKLLGHTNIKQTLGYAQVVRDDLHEAVEKAELQFDAAVGAEVAA